jgi:hypothetical protein
MDKYAGGRRHFSGKAGKSVDSKFNSNPGQMDFLETRSQ